MSHASENPVVVAPSDAVRPQRAEPAVAPPTVPPAVSAAAIKTIERPGVFVGELNPFIVKSWANVQAQSPDPVAPPPEEAPAPAPTAPPLPFAFAGKLEDEPGHWIVYLARGDQSFALSKGDTFDTNYRFEGLEDGKLVITYLPLATKQFLPVGKDEQFK